FSSRRRHTISKRDWSSDVCSSDLSLPIINNIWLVLMFIDLCPQADKLSVKSGLFLRGKGCYGGAAVDPRPVAKLAGKYRADTGRSEERRVGKECRDRGLGIECKHN